MACDTGILYQGPIKAQAVLFLIQDPVEVLKKAEKKNDPSALALGTLAGTRIESWIQTVPQTFGE